MQSRNRDALRLGEHQYRDSCGAGMKNGRVPDTSYIWDACVGAELSTTRTSHKYQS